MKKTLGILVVIISCMALLVSCPAEPPATYTVTYHPNGATGGSVPVDSTVYEVGDQVTVKDNENSLSNTGYAFLGWNLQSDGTGTSYSAGDSFTISGADVTLYALWGSLSISVSQQTTEIAAGDTFDFGAGVVGIAEDAVFTIASTGAGTVELQDPYVRLETDWPYWFTLEAMPSPSIGAGDSTDFTIRCTPQEAGAGTGTVTICLGEEDDFIFTVSATATAVPEPEMSVLREDTTILDGTSYSFGSTEIDTTAEAEFVIHNSGTTDLVLDGTPKVEISGTDTSFFNVSIQPSSPVAAGGETSFTVQFSPTVTESKSATLSISNNDADENPYNFEISGWGTTAPEINLKRDTTYIPSGSAGGDFGTVMTGDEADLEFTIENTGSADLNITGDVTLSGTDAGDFLITGQPSTPVTFGGGTSAFTVRFNPQSTGSKTATVSIPNSDLDANPYTFTVSGAAEAWHGARLIDATDDVGLWSSLATSGTEDLYISYYDETNGNLKFARSDNGGISWTTMTVDSFDDVGRYSSVDISSDGETVFISYWDVTNNDLNFAKSTDGGYTWPSGYWRIVDSTGSVGGYSDIAVASDTKQYIAYYDWANRDLRFARTTDTGNTWPFITTIDTGGTGFVGTGISMYDITDWVYISYIGANTYDVLFTKSTSSGDSWTAPVIAYDVTISDIKDYTSLVYGSTSYIVYSYSTVLAFVKSVDSGATWSSETIIDYIASSSDTPMRLKVAGTTLHLAYSDGTDILYTSSTDGGTNWSTPVTVHPGADFTYTVSLAVSGSTIYIVYHDGTAEERDLYIAKSIDGGITW